MPYAYIFIRQDLSIAQQIVQASHAAMEMGYQQTKIDHTHICLIGTKDLKALEKVRDHLVEHEIGYTVFFEPDIAEHTAICTIPLQGRARQALRKFQCYK